MAPEEVVHGPLVQMGENAKKLLGEPLHFVDKKLVQIWLTGHLSELEAVVVGVEKVPWPICRVLLDECIGRTKFRRPVTIDQDPSRYRVSSLTSLV